MYNLLEAAKNDEKNEEYSFFLQGDLCQMATQGRFLGERGIKIKQNNVYPCVRECDKTAALKLIWDCKVEGWWHYKESYVKRGICTTEEYRTRLIGNLLK